MLRTSNPLSLATVAVFLAGCGGCDPALQAAVGELVAIVDGTSTNSSRSIDVDFGEIYAGSVGRARVDLRNAGRGELELSAELEAQEGGSAFAFELAATRLAGSDEAPLELIFAPPAERSDQPRTFEGTLRIETRGERPGTGPLLINMRGASVPDPCALPELLDFGPIERGETYRLDLTLRNTLSRSVEAAIGQIEAATTADQLAFKRSEPRGESLAIQPQSSITLGFEFRPLETREYNATVRIRASDQCDWRDVRLTGRGTDEVVVWQPRVVDCGFVPDGLTARRTLTITNQRPSTIQLSRMRIEPPGEFEFEDVGRKVEALTFEGRSSRSLTVLCRPSPPGRREAALKFDTDVARQPQVEVPLFAHEGGPDIEITPSPVLDFGPIGVIEGSSPPQRWTRRVHVANVGTNPPGDDPAANLKLGRVGENGVHSPPFFEIRPLNSQTDSAELGVELESEYDGEQGLPPGAASLRAWVSFSPVTAGRKEAELVVYSNDLDEPEATIRITADAQVVPECNYRVSPPSLEFGVVTPPTRAVKRFVIENLGRDPGDVCLVSGIELEPGSDSQFELKAPSSTMIGPAETLELDVVLDVNHAAPENALVLAGALEFEVASTTRPRTRVPLSATIGSACLIVAPLDIDFGVVRPGCRSVEKRVALQNVCTFPVTVEAIELLGGHGDFLLTDVPNIPPQGLTLEPEAAPHYLGVRYAPSSTGSHSAILIVRSRESGRAVERAVNLIGRANELGRTVEQFEQRNREKLDVLLAIEGGNSMNTEAPLVEENVGAFLSYLLATNADFHFAVVHMTDHEVYAPRGTFWVPAGHSEPFLSATTTDVMRKGREKARMDFIFDPNVARAGVSCFENALRGLLPPLSEGFNAGFLRTDARLAVVCITNRGFEGSSRLFPYERPLADFPPAFFALKSNDVGMFSLSAIAPFDPQKAADCLNVVDSQGRYPAMAAMTGGLLAEICSTEWSATLERIAEDATEYLTRFQLRGVPDEGQSPIVVRVDGQVVDQDDPSGAMVWRYEESGNEVRFEPARTPPPGAKVEIEYVSQCS